MPRRPPAGSGHVTGRWALLPEVDTDPTRRAHATAERMLERHGVVTRGAVMSERTLGGFAAVYKVLSAFEDSGRCRRGYFVEGLGAAQFGTAGAIDRLRTFAEPRGRPGVGPSPRRSPSPPPTRPTRSVAALPWPERETSGGHRPGRKAGALVVLVDGALTLYVERGGRTLLTWTDDAALLGPAALSLSEAGRRGALGRLTVEKADGDADPRRRFDPAARGARRGRLRVDSPGAEAACLRATPSGGPRAPSTARCRATR